MTRPARGNTPLRPGRHLPGAGQVMNALSAGMPIIAIGASAGGLDAVSRLLDALPANSGAAFLLVQHLDPSHKSLLADLLSDHTTMPVTEAREGETLGADHVYVIPPGRYLSLHAGALRLSAVEVHHGARLPFDFLLKSLAASHGTQTVAVILSGHGADGSRGLAALKAAGGRAVAQDPAEAEYPGMPQGAIATGVVDHVVPLAGMPAILAQLTGTAQPSLRTTPEPASADPAAILAYLKTQTGHDFAHYKPGTMARRIARRMGLLALPSGDLAAYLAFLTANAAECDMLVGDLLINVTSFFRDPQVFEALEAIVIPELLQRLAPGSPLRVWVAGCSTGEEAYSIAMACSDAIAAAGRTITLQIFASDLDPAAVAFAREGLYAPDIATTMPAERLARYFVHEDAGYRVAQNLRAPVVFSVQDVLADPPFSRIDLIACRNLLIYLNVAAQAKVIALFHFALREEGVLLLGASETIACAEGRFEPVTRAECCFRHVGKSSPGKAGFPFSVSARLPLPSPGGPSPTPRQVSLADLSRRAVLASYAPAAVLVNRRHECLFTLGPIHRYLRMPTGYATHDLLAMAAPAISGKLRLAIARASQAEPRIDGGRACVSIDGAAVWFRIDVQYLSETGEALLLVCFVEEPAVATAASSALRPADITRIAELEQELVGAQADLHTALHERALADQKQKAINEEALSVNEEIQSTNEELLTSKEELQSLNEELTALNGQLQETLDRQRLASADLQNVLNSTNVGTMFLDAGLKIRFFTPAISPLFNVIASDIGRPLGDLRPLAEDPELLGDAARVLAAETVIEREVITHDDVWYLRRIFPYRAHDGRIEGVVITFADITERKHITSALEAAKLEADRANAAKSRFLAAASHDLRQPMQALTLLKDLLTRAMPTERGAALLVRFDQTLRALSGMLDVLLNINQIEAGVIHPKRTVFPVADMFDRLRNETTSLAQARSLTLTILPCSAMVESDPQLLEQMVRNLLGNAIKYTHRGKIMLGCRRRSGQLRIEVWDTGIGIEPDQLHAIFEEFHQVDNPARMRSQGLGLGLAIVQRLGALLGHDIDVKSRPKKGSVFAITVPRDPAEALAVAGSALPPPPPLVLALPDAADHPRAQVMIVEDDAELRDLLVEMLRADGFLVTSAANAVEALDLIVAAAVRPEVVLTDYNLPDGGNGVDLVSALRARLGEDLPAIVLTGDISAKALAEIGKIACQHLRKPVDATQLIQRIASLCAQPAVAAPATANQEMALSGMTYVVDDDAQVRTAIRELLAGHGLAVQDFGSAEAFLAAYQPGGTGCLLVDAHLPGMSGVALLAHLRASGDHYPVIFLTGDGDVGLAVKAMRAGACEFIEKPVGQADLLASIARATDQSHDSRMIDAAHAQALARIANLTARQKLVMDMVLAGHPSKNIASDLGISQRTVENHRAEVMLRMGAKSIPELARMVLVAHAA